MKSFRLQTVSMLFAASVVIGATAGCVAPPGYYPLGGGGQGEEQVRFGDVVRIDPVSLEGDQQLGLGAVIGGIAGGVLGHQFGGGNGRDVATVLGALGGAAAGTVTQNRYAERRYGQHIMIRLRNGVAIGITQAGDSGLRVGDPVEILGSGPDARVRRR